MPMTTASTMTAKRPSLRVGHVSLPVVQPSTRVAGWRVAALDLERYLCSMPRLSRLISLPFIRVALASTVVAVPLASIAEAARSPSTAHDDSVATFLREAAQHGTLAGLKWPHFTNAQPAVDSLYARHGWRPVWTSRGRPTS